MNNKITDYKIHTRTICANFNHPFTSPQIFEQLKIQPPIVHIVYKNQLKDNTGVSIKTTTTNNNNKRAFGNDHQVTIVFRIEDCNINMKVFESGSLQLTGCRKINAAHIACNVIAEKLNGIISNFRLCGVKIGFAINSEIDLVTFDNILQTNYNLISSFDPNSSEHGFHGIKTTLYWNNYKDGICRCEPNDEYDKCPCLSVSVVIFRTGSIGMMSNGYATDSIIDEIYRFFSHIIMKHYDDISIIYQADHLVENYNFAKLIYKNTQGHIVKIRSVILNDNASEHEHMELCDPGDNS